MKKLFSSTNMPELGLLQSLLEESGIATEVRNENIYASFPTTAFQPEIWVVNDGDYPRACELRDAWQASLPTTPDQPPETTRNKTRSNSILFGMYAALLIIFAVFGVFRSAPLGYWRDVVFEVMLGLLGAVLGWTAITLYPRDRNK